jgi:CubicO group peptidase (beta-lactamase class C family)
MTKYFALSGFVVLLLLAALLVFTDVQVPHISTAQTDFCPAEYEQQQKLIMAQKSAKQVKSQWVDSLVQQWYTSNRFNGTILVAERGEVLYRGALGYGNFDTKDTLSLSSPFQLASVSKPITAIAVLTLLEQGKLELDAPVQRYLPALPYDKVTVRHLLTHRSGLSRYMYLGHHYWSDKEIALSNCDMLDLFVKYKLPLEFTPGSKFVYSNSNYALLASLVEELSGKDFDEYVRDAIFLPLGMNNSFIYTKCKNEAVPDKVLGYVPSGRGRYGPVENDYLNGVTGDKGAYSTVEDLFKLDQALYDETLLKRETLEAAFTPYGKLPKSFKDDYGLGWRIDKYRPNIVYHTGWWKGFRTMFIRKLDTRHTIIALNNRENMLPYKLCWEILDQLNNLPDVSPLYAAPEAENGDQLGGGL